MMNKTLYVLVFAVLMGASWAMSASLTSNRTFADYGESLNLTMSASGGITPYFYTLRDPSNVTLITLASPNATNFVITPPLGVDAYTLEVMDGTGGNTTSTTLSLTVNAMPHLQLNPQSLTIIPYSNLTFTNSIVGGTPPYTYLYNISGGAYNLTNNTVTFNGITIYMVKLFAKDSLNETAHNTSTIVTAYPQTVVNASDSSRHYSIKGAGMTSVQNMGNCLVAVNMSQTEVDHVSIVGKNVMVVENYITPEYAGVTLDGDSIRLNFTPKVNYQTMNGYYVFLGNLSWTPILVTVDVVFCPGTFIPAQTTTTTTTTTTLPTTMTTKPTTTHYTSSIFTTLTTTIAPLTTIAQTSQPIPLGDLIFYLVGIFGIVAIVLIAFMRAKATREDEGNGKDEEEEERNDNDEKAPWDEPI